jgi:peptidyl-prolyl cis-trans isomerase C
MKSTLFCACLMSTALWAQIPPATAIAPDMVVATVDGKKLTAGEVRRLVEALPPQGQQQFAYDPKEVVRQRVLMAKLSAMAEKAKLDQQDPYKERIEYQKQLVLSQAQVEHQFEAIPAPESEWRAFYDKNKNMFSEAKLRVIYIPFDAHPKAAEATGAKPLTETEAKAQAEAALAEIRKGVPFADVVKKYSKDTASAAKGGDFGAIKRTSADIPPEIKNVIFSTKAGETAAPFRHTNGYYLFHVVGYTVVAYEQVKGDVESQVKRAKFDAWLKAIRDSIEIKVENEAFFARPRPRE